MESSMKGFEHLEIQLEDIKSATNNFSEENVIGRGGFGKVYKGELCHSHSKRKMMVALKRLDRRHGQGDAEFHKEVRMLSCYRHENIVSLLGFSSGRDEMILVYEYASRGSLDRHLKDVTLTWTQRIKVCLDAAKGLCYLHDPRESYQRLIHCDIKSANILLDENFKAKVSDFGLSKVGPANQQNSILVTGPLGSRGYCDPVFMETYTLTKESDVYSFGVVLFEVLCGKLCVEYSKGHLKVIHVPMWKQSYEQKQLDQIILEDIKQQMNPGSLETFSGIAYQCLKRFREERPAMSLVVEKLQESLALQELHDLKLLKEYEEIVNAAVPPLNYRSLDELKVLLTEGFHVNEGTRQGYFSKFELNTLFYIFYSMPKDEAQLYAANELHNRGWFYHREIRLWFMRAGNMEPLVKTNTYERGSYIFFDPNTWETIHKDNFMIHYEMLEKRPTLPQQRDKSDIFLLSHQKKQGYLSKFELNTLFYIFYSMPKDEAQLYAANELHNRGWFYYRENRLWVMRAGNMEPLVKTNTYERGSYICFDPNTWETISKDNFVIHYEMLEKRPTLPLH